ncbi:hypothetical protein ACK8P5_13000 [Paenibacillus sp. EC2-1]|uniref:hypothetical protein n=1 Tax=Paenibacillus sp. EC2-1 TaxID=3388665 RepID=UPI003BEEF64C
MKDSDKKRVGMSSSKDSKIELDELSNEELDELESIEKRMEPRLSSLTVPVPSREDTFQLIEFVKKNGAGDVVQEPEELDLFQQTSSNEKQCSRLLGLIRSQWNAYGFRSWLTTGASIVATGYIASTYHTEKYNDLFLWTLGLTLIILGTIVYAFRPRDQGTMILEQLGKYSLLEQTLTRLILVMLFQIVVAVPLSFIFIDQGAQNSLIGFIVGWSIPVISGALISFVFIQWFGVWKSVLMLFVLGIITLEGNKSSLPEEMVTFSRENDFEPLRWMMLLIAAGLFIFYLLSQRKAGNQLDE